MFPEGNIPSSRDDEARSLKKWNAQLVEIHGAVGEVPFPEGTNPSSGDDAERSTKKINAILAAV